MGSYLSNYVLQCLHPLQFINPNRKSDIPINFLNPIFSLPMIYFCIYKPIKKYGIKTCIIFYVKGIFEELKGLFLILVPFGLIFSFVSFLSYISPV